MLTCTCIKNLHIRPFFNNSEQLRSCPQRTGTKKYIQVYEKMSFTTSHLLTYGGPPLLGALIGYEKAVQFGLVPFIPGDIAKLLLAAIVFPATWKWLKRNG